MLELCNARSGLLNPRLVTKVPTIAEMIDDYKSGKMPLMGVVYSWLLARIAEHLEVTRARRDRPDSAEFPSSTQMDRRVSRRAAMSSVLQEHVIGADVSAAHR